MSKNYFDLVDPKVNFPDLEKKTIEYWNKNKIFDKSVNKNKSKKSFVFYEGPPTANGKPGIHHVLARSFKDLFPRYHTMKGEYVLRKGGWDTHGLPVEIGVEKELGISGKKDIENLVPGDKTASIAKFNKLCRESVFRYVEDWNDLTQRMGYWVNTEEAYVTLSNEYIESCWNILKDFYGKGLLEKDYKVVPYCPRCGTPLSSHELSQGYADVEDPSIFIKFHLVSEDADLLVWTTTPWTLPGNVALAIDQNADYVKVKGEVRPMILAKSRIAIVKDAKILETFKGKELIGKKYEPLFSFYDYGEKAYQVLPADFVSMEEGTGIVHTAVMYGADDFELGKKYDLPRHHLVNLEGKFIDEVAPWKGVFVKKADQLIIEDLEKRGLLFRSEKVTHSYPLCWRCKTPLLYYAIESWFIRTTKRKEEIIKENYKTNWIPKHMKTGRMGKWLDGMIDWSLSRFRYWGTPLPVWRCEKCDHNECVGSIKDLEKLAGKKIEKDFDLHKPYIDEITGKCEKCSGKMVRYSEVIDVWFDSGAMPFAQWHYPFENQKTVDDGLQFPADFIAEGQDQTRGWFYTLMAVSTLIKGKNSYKNVISHNLVLDKEGKKMSKSVGNVVNPWDEMDKFGADTVRWYFYSGNVAKPYLFDEKYLMEISRSVFRILWNSYNFFVTYANLDGWKPTGRYKLSDNVLDKWIIARLNETAKIITGQLDKYHSQLATSAIEEFINDFSQWYIRRSRERVGPAAASEEDKNAFYETCYFVLVTLLKLMAPFAPFVTENMYKNLTKEESIHLSEWPSYNEKLIDKQVLESMADVRKVVENAHSERKLAGIPVRQPLNSLATTYSFPVEFQNVIKAEINVKNIIKGKSDAKLDTKITPELEEEAKARELIRKIQQERKEMGMNLTQKVSVFSPWIPRDQKLLNLILARTMASSLTSGEFKVVKLK